MVSPFLITQAVRARKVKTFLWIIGSTFFIVATVVDYFIHPAYNKQDKTGKIYIDVLTPLITVGSKRIFTPPCAAFMEDYKSSRKNRCISSTTDQYSY